MAYTTPRTWVAGELVTAALLNAQLRDNMSAVRATPSNRCDAYHSTTQVCTTIAVLNLDLESYDSGSMHDLVTNNSRITIPAGGAGTYLVFGRSQTTDSNGDFHIYVNGSSVRKATAAVSGLPPMDIQAALVLAAADYVELAATNGTWGSASAALATRLTVIGPLPPT